MRKAKSSRKIDRAIVGESAFLGAIYKLRVGVEKFIAETASDQNEESFCRNLCGWLNRLAQIVEP